APWLDSISREWLDSGELERLRDTYALRGVTSNPSIFQAALKSDVYHDDIRRFAADGLDDRTIFHRLAVDDIQRACDVFAVVHEATGDGYVSIEVDPDLAHDTEGTIEQARTLHAAVARPNVLIKIPATEAGIPAIEQVLTDGIGVNITLLFDSGVAGRVREAWLRALTTRHEAGLPVSGIASVASFFVSRVDAKVDPLLDALDSDEVSDLRGTAAVANAALSWADAQRLHEDPRWLTLEAAGATSQRLLWASTGTKDPSYSSVKYVEELVAVDTVNTLPLATIKAFAAYTGDVRIAIDSEHVQNARRQLDRLAECGIDFSTVTDELRDEGVAAFVASFEGLLADVATARAMASTT
ncbi:MAG: transaldolase, partial [Gaiellales bacterium]